MRSGRAQGYAIITDPDTPMPKESDTFTCGHCNTVVFVKPAADPTTYGGWCGQCTKLICAHCEAEKVRTLACRPFEKWLEQQEARAASRRSLQLGG